MPMTCEIQGNEYELPTLRLPLARKMDSIDSAQGREATWRAELEFVQAVLGKDEAEAVLGGASVADCDLVALDAATVRIRAAYEEPAAEAERERIERQLSVLDTSQLDTLLRATEAMGQLQGRQGFRKVR